MAPLPLRGARLPFRHAEPLLHDRLVRSIELLLLLDFEIHFRLLEIGGDILALVDEPRGVISLQTFDGSWRVYAASAAKIQELSSSYGWTDIETGRNLGERVGDTLDAAIILSREPEPSFHSLRLDRNRVYAFTSQQLAAEIGPEPDGTALAKQTFLVHNDLPDSFDAWKAAMNLAQLQPAAIDHFDSGQLILEAAAQGLGIAIMHADHFERARDERLARLFDVEVESAYSYWFICRPRDLASRPVRIFHEWVLKAGL